MAANHYEYKPKDVEDITPREFNFDFKDDMDPCWVPNEPERSYFFNGASITMPYLEPFLMRTMRQAISEVDESEKDLLADMKHFIQQEGNHYKCHRRFNEILKANGQPQLKQIEKRLEKFYQKLEKKSLRKRLAYCAGFESMTCGFTTWLIRRRKALFFKASPEVTSFWLMHMVEEAEHKTVAHDAYMATSGNYLARTYGVFHGAGHVYWMSVVGMFSALKQDGLLSKPRTWFRAVKELASGLRYVGPFFLRALKPGYDPRDEADPQWMKEWLNGHANLATDKPLPLIDTSDPNMPVPYPKLYPVN